MTKTITICDVCKKEITDPQKIKKEFLLPVIFHTDTTEGKAATPHVESVKMDICLDCYMKSINIHAVGAQGNNQYWFGEKNP